MCCYWWDTYCCPINVMSLYWCADNCVMLHGNMLQRCYWTYLPAIRWTYKLDTWCYYWDVTWNVACVCLLLLITDDVSYIRCYKDPIMWCPTDTWWWLYLLAFLLLPVMWWCTNNDLATCPCFEMLLDEMPCTYIDGLHVNKDALTLCYLLTYVMMCVHTKTLEKMLPIKFWRCSALSYKDT